MQIQIRDRIHSVGVVDWSVRDFHGYNTERGATYNAYLIQDQKNALIDTVKAPFAQDFLNNVAKVLDLQKIDYVIINHAEPDHTSALPAVMQALPQATLLCSKKCVPVLSAYYDTSNWKIQAVGTGDTLNLGKHTLSFVEIPLVHWPDSMVTYLADEKILFSSDAFGQHYSSSSRFDDENPMGEIMDEARIYYANIVNPYGKRVQQVLEILGGLSIEMICPSHGVIWRSYVGEIIKAYHNWAWNRSKAKVVIVFETMWNSTGAMAEAILEGAAQPGVEVKLFNIRHSNNTHLVTEFLDCACVAFGSSTLNQGMLPSMASLLCYTQGLNFQNRAGVAFGSFGWGKGGPEALAEKITDLKWELLSAPLKAKYRPTVEDLQDCYLMGKKLAEKALALSAASNYQKLAND